MHEFKDRYGKKIEAGDIIVHARASFGRSVHLRAARVHEVKQTQNGNSCYLLVAYEGDNPDRLHKIIAGWNVVKMDPTGLRL